MVCDAQTHTQTPTQTHTQTPTLCTFSTYQCNTCLLDCQDRISTMLVQCQRYLPFHECDTSQVHCPKGFIATHKAAHFVEKKRKEKTTPFGVNLTRSLVLYQAVVH